PHDLGVQCQSISAAGHERHAGALERANRRAVKPLRVRAQVVQMADRSDHARSSTRPLKEWGLAPSLRGACPILLGPTSGEQCKGDAVRYAICSTVVAAKREFMQQADTPNGAAAGKTRSVRLAAVSDLHCARSSQGVFQPLLAQAGAAGDILV